MKLKIKRDQQAQTGVFGGHKGMNFLLSYKVELTPEEMELVKKYKMEGYVLTEINDGKGTTITKDTVTRLIQGYTEGAKDVTTLYSNEETVKNACKHFRDLLEVMKTFGGEEVFEF